MSHWYTRPRKIPVQAGFVPRIFRFRGGRLTTRPTRRSPKWARDTTSAGKVMTTVFGTTYGTRTERHFPLHHAALQDSFVARVLVMSEASKLVCVLLIDCQHEWRAGVGEVPVGLASPCRRFESAKQKRCHRLPSVRGCKLPLTHLPPNLTHTLWCIPVCCTLGTCQVSPGFQHDVIA